MSIANLPGFPNIGFTGPTGPAGSNFSNTQFQNGTAGAYTSGFNNVIYTSATIFSGSPADMIAVDLQWLVVGPIVTTTSGTIDTTVALPSVYRPLSTKVCSAVLVINSVPTVCSIVVATSGIISIYKTTVATGNVRTIFAGGESVSFNDISLVYSGTH